MENTCALIGFGELGIQFKSFLEVDKKLRFIYFDDAAFKNKIEDAYPFADFMQSKFDQYDFYVALGYHHLQTKSNLLSQLITASRRIPSYVHRSGFVASGVVVGSGSFVYPMCTIDKDVTIGKGCLLNNGVIVSHNSTIGNCCFLSPGVIISGNVIIGEQTFIGAGSIVANNITIGKKVIIGAGCVITKDVADNVSVIGNPMRILNKKINLI